MFRTATRPAAVVVTFLTAVLVSLGLAGTASAADGVYAFGPTRVTEFTMVAGQQWATATGERLTRTGFVVTEDGRFAMLQPDDYPQLVGTIDRTGAFRATEATTYGATGTNTTTVQGVFRPGANGTATVSFTYTAGMVNAAVVNGTAFGASSSKAYHATVELQHL